MFQKENGNWLSKWRLIKWWIILIRIFTLTVYLFCLIKSEVRYVNRITTTTLIKSLQYFSIQHSIHATKNVANAILNACSPHFKHSCSYLLSQLKFFFFVSERRTLDLLFKSYPAAICHRIQTWRCPLPSSSVSLTSWTGSPTTSTSLSLWCATLGSCSGEAVFGHLDVPLNSLVCVRVDFHLEISSRRTFKSRDHVLPVQASANHLEPGKMIRV